MENNKIDDGGSAFPHLPYASDSQNWSDGSGGMSLRDYFARNVPQDEVSEMTWKHLSLLAQEKLAGMKRPDRDSDLRGDENINQQIETMKFHAKVTAALRYIAADAMLTARKEGA